MEGGIVVAVIREEYFPEVLKQVVAIFSILQSVLLCYEFWFQKESVQEKLSRLI